MSEAKSRQAGRFLKHAQAEAMPEKYWNPEYQEELEQDAYSYKDEEYEKYK